MASIVKMEPNNFDEDYLCDSYLHVLKVKPEPDVFFTHVRNENDFSEINFSLANVVPNYNSKYSYLLVFFLSVFRFKNYERNSDDLQSKFRQSLHLLLQCKYFRFITVKP